MKHGRTKANGGNIESNGNSDPIPPFEWTDTVDE